MRGVAKSLALCAATRTMWNKDRTSTSSSASATGGGLACGSENQTATVQAQRTFQKLRRKNLNDVRLYLLPTTHLPRH